MIDSRWPVVALALVSLYGIAYAVTSAPVDVHVQVIVPGSAVPVTITLAPSSSVVTLDTATAGTVLATASVTMSDSSPFAGSLVSSNPGLVGFSGMDAVLARNLASADDGFYNITISPVSP